MKPKYERVADDLRNKIISKKYYVDQLIPSETNLQKKFSVSRHTVRQAIGVLVNEGYLRKEQGSGTYVSLPEYQSHSLNKTIGVIVTYLSDYIFPSIIRGIEQELKSQGYSLLLGSTNNDHQQEKLCLERMMALKVDGVIVEPTKSNQYNPNLAYYVELHEKKIPVLMINAFYEELEVDHICVNDWKSGYLATKYLIDNNHEQILSFYKTDDLQGKYRIKGFIRAISEAKLKLNPSNIVTYTTETKTKEIENVAQYLKNNPKITGVVCYNDEVASLLMDKLQEKQIVVPQDVSIIGNDDSNLSRTGKIQLTTLTHPKENMGTMAAASLIDSINEKKVQSYFFDPILIERESVRKLSKS
ncbi:GntR family transcriptional regulator [Enterococcus casseliflavus]|uniref:GntR family transcriptional regulator n=1 Tax=Enterococcus casseliflavus TaxID=37734 RepID=UPI000EAF1087|nr:GntR family transcriptional regulator [Enterococcus casseliflavus]AYJ45882.1 GntR family transcriptional regulator [Enterococcus casseliflavus]MBS5814673.1 GntR family transcriptional regulator [Enterococcus casseliflavus]MCD4963202.1 GntR family transcriptional regulator [Enterococcus casseliflavus]MDT2974305.1 GntR family transcriptional regulator [Enterococcus casseliflavus]MDU3373197.1 GntR family transcriptional regulator [Enterococcus casseliflavus]